MATPLYQYMRKPLPTPKGESAAAFFVYLCQFLYLKRLYSPFFLPSVCCDLTREDKRSVEQLSVVWAVHYSCIVIRQERKVQFYADLLHVSIGHLFAVIKRVSGKSPGDWIDEYVVSEAHILLKGSSLTIQQISQELGFPSQSFFGKYFKRVMGVSPKEYREAWTRQYAHWQIVNKNMLSADILKIQDLLTFTYLKK